ncbi:MAG: adenylyltransferase/cytidyltransferase family protein [Patescibacteria group bacterium]
MTEANERKIIALSGGFDPLHRGHLDMIKDAAVYGKVIIILNSDLWLERKKGYHLMDWEDRAEILKALKYVEDVIPADDLNGGTVCCALRTLKPDFFGNGGDRTISNTPEVATCEELGTEMIWGLGGDKIQSSSELIDSVVNSIIKKLTRW